MHPTMRRYHAERRQDAELGYIITGLGRSGTTFLAHVFQKAGYDLGNVDEREIGKNRPIGGGLEYPPFAHTNIRLQKGIHDLWETKNPDEARLPDIESLLEQERLAMERPWPFVLKDPRFCDTAFLWYAAGYAPKHVFLCMRNPMERNASITQMMTGVSAAELRYIDNVQRTYYQYFSIYNLELLCMEKDIPFTLVHYPRIGEDQDYAERSLGRFIKSPWNTISEVWETSMHHQKL